MGMMQRIAGWAGFEKRNDAADPSWAALAPAFGYPSHLSAHAAENLSTVLACTNAVATALSYVPPVVYRRDADGSRVEMTSHPLVKIARQGVSDQQTWPDFIESFVASTLLVGNGIATIHRSGNGQLTGFRFIPWGTVSVSELSSGRLVYDISDGRGGMKRYLEGEVLHLRDRSDDGKIGRSVLSRAAATVAGVASANDHANAFLQNGASPSGWVEVPGTMTTAQRASLRDSFQNRHGGAANAGSTLVLDGGMKWSPSQISPEDAELLETRKFGVVEICRLFKVPPPIVQSYEYNSFTNAAQAGLWFATFCLAPWAKKIEAEFARSVFPAGSDYELELDLSGFLRGDPETRWAAHKIAIEANVLDPDEVRQIEGWNPRSNAGGQNG